MSAITPNSNPAVPPSKAEPSPLEKMDPIHFPTISHLLGPDAWKLNVLSKSTNELTGKHWKVLAKKLKIIPEDVISPEQNPQAPKQGPSDSATAKENAHSLPASYYKNLVLEHFKYHDAIQFMLKYGYPALKKILEETSKSEKALYEKCIGWLQDQCFGIGFEAMLKADIDELFKPESKFNKNAISLRVIRDANIPLYNYFRREWVWIVMLKFVADPLENAELQQSKQKEMLKYLFNECALKHKNSSEFDKFLKELLKQYGGYMATPILFEILYEQGYTSQIVDVTTSLFKNDFDLGVRLRTNDELVSQLQTIMKYLDKPVRNQVFRLAWDSFKASNSEVVLIQESTFNLITKMIRETPFYGDELKQKAAEAEKKAKAAEVDQKQGHASTQGPNPSPPTSSSVLDID